MEMVNYHGSRPDASSGSGTGWWGFQKRNHRRSIGETLTLTTLHNTTAWFFRVVGWLCVHTLRPTVRSLNPKKRRVSSWWGKVEGFLFLDAISADCKEGAIPATHSQYLPSCPSRRKPF